MPQLRARLERMLDAADVGVWHLHVPSGELTRNAVFLRLIQASEEELAGGLFAWADRIHHEDREQVLEKRRQLLAGELDEYWVDYRVRRATGEWVWLRGRVITLDHDGQGKPVWVCGLTMDFTALREAERRLAATERLESIGQLAAGVAHEINTPIQYVGDSVYFIREAVEELLAHARITEKSPAGSPADDGCLAKLAAELSGALDRVDDGLSRVAEIIRSMRYFSHADEAEMVPIDLNLAIQSTLVMARNEFKYVADLETDYGALPPVTCHGSQINQVVLNLIVNAAHAIGERVQGSAERGLISVRTFLEGSEAVIAIGDTGAGIQEAIRLRIFEPFFTTKEVGRGTGQGLSIAHRNIQAHGGRIHFETAVGKGTTFFVRLPIVAQRDPSSADVPLGEGRHARASAWGDG
jgi:PAS domain S-box-containing protein